MGTSFTKARVFDVQAFIDSQRFSRFHWILFVLCFLMVALDGLDTGIVGYLAPTLIKDLQVSRASLGPMLSASLIGVGVGSLLVGPLADRIGRKFMIIGSMILLGVFSCAGAFVHSLESLAVMRFLTGIGLGAALPNTITLMAEYAPERIRSTVINTMLVGWSVGAAGGGWVTAALIQPYGWRGVMLLGGVAPLVLACLLPLLPESVKYLVVNSRSRQRVAKILTRISPPTRVDNCEFVCNETAGTGNVKRFPILELLSERYVFGTFMIWLAYFMCLVVLYLISNWLPLLFTGSGYSMRESAITSSMFQFGGAGGMVIGGWLMDKVSSGRVFSAARAVALFFTLTAVAMLLVGKSMGHGPWLMVALIAGGAVLFASSSSMSSLTALFYPTTSRVTGVAWMFGLGRFGAVAGTFAGAFLLSTGWSFTAVFSMLAIPSMVAALALMALGRHEARAERQSSMTSPAVMTGS